MNKIVYLILGLIIFRALTINFYLSDELVYWNMSRAYARGEQPYSTFFLAHPPFILALFPFAGSLLGIRLALLFIQVCILVLFNGILRLKGVEENKRLILCVILMVSTAFYNNFNQYLGFGLTTLLVLASYYFYLKEQHFPCVLYMSIAICTRLFALFPALLLFYAYTVREKQYQILIFAPLIFLLLIYPSMFQQVFLYHLDSKALMNPGTRLEVMFSYLFFEGFIFFLLIKKRSKELLVALVLLVGVSVNKIVLFMYFSMVTPWLLLASSKLSYKTLLYLCVFFVITWFIRQPIPFTDYPAMIDLVGRYNLPVTGDMSVMNLLSIRGNLSLVGGVYDTSAYRFREVVPLYNKPHILICKNMPDRVTICDFVNHSNYRRVGVVDQHSFYVWGNNS